MIGIWCRSPKYLLFLSCLTLYLESPTVLTWFPCMLYVYMCDHVVSKWLEKRLSHWVTFHGWSDLFSLLLGASHLVYLFGKWKKILRFVFSYIAMLQQTNATKFLIPHELSTHDNKESQLPEAEGKKKLPELGGPWESEARRPRPRRPGSWTAATASPSQTNVELKMESNSFNKTKYMSSWCSIVPGYIFNPEELHLQLPLAFVINFSIQQFFYSQSKFRSWCQQKMKKGQ